MFAIILTIAIILLIVAYFIRKRHINESREELCIEMCKEPTEDENCETVVKDYKPVAEEPQSLFEDPEINGVEPGSYEDKRDWVLGEVKEMYKSNKVWKISEMTKASHQTIEKILFGDINTIREQTFDKIIKNII